MFIFKDIRKHALELINKQLNPGFSVIEVKVIRKLYAGYEVGVLIVGPFQNSLWCCGVIYISNSGALMSGKVINSWECFKSDTLIAEANKIIEERRVT